MDHTNPWDLDEALIAWGYGRGACEAQDVVGLDTILAAHKAADPSPVLSRMVAEGRIGKKAGWGYYRYPGGGGAVIDPLIEDLILEEARFANHPRMELEGEALVGRLHSLVGRQVRKDPKKAVALLHFPAERLGDM